MNATFTAALFFVLVTGAFLGILFALIRFLNSDTKQNNKNERLDSER